MKNAVLSVCFVLCCLTQAATVMAQSGNLVVPKKDAAAKGSTQQSSVSQAQRKTDQAHWVDLGLPSGTLWKALNESGFYSYDEAVSRFGSNLPSDSQLEELKDYCQWTWTGSGYKVVGPNGNSIVLPAAGFPDSDGSVVNTEVVGLYWSSTASGSEEAMSLAFEYVGAHLGWHYRSSGLSVRLAQDCDQPAVAEPKQNKKNTEGSHVPMGYVDLGLPSGTYWKALNESGFYTYDEAVSRFGSNLPSDSQFKELKDYCQWTWSGSGYKVVGPNGDSIVLPAAGYRWCLSGSYGLPRIGECGYYWSLSSIGSMKEVDVLFFDAWGKYLDWLEYCFGFSVRLVQD